MAELMKKCPPLDELLEGSGLCRRSDSRLFQEKMPILGTLGLRSGCSVVLRQLEASSSHGLALN